MMSRWRMRSQLGDEFTTTTAIKVPAAGRLHVAARNRVEQRMSEAMEGELFGVKVFEVVELDHIVLCHSPVGAGPGGWHRVVQQDSV